VFLESIGVTMPEIEPPGIPCAAHGHRHPGTLIDGRRERDREKWRSRRACTSSSRLPEQS
jgi:hypothetical protein